MTVKGAAFATVFTLGLMSGTAHAALIFNDTTPGATTFTIGPGTYIIQAVGAGGGSTGLKSGGYGANVTGTFTFAQSETLNFLVGSRGASTGGSEDSGGGGGGTYVVGPFDTPLLIGGGGGGGGDFSSDGGNGQAFVLVGGQGGAAGSGSSGGGGGFVGNGQGPGGMSYLNGGAGGIDEHPGGIGGGGAGSSGFSGGGGGGGYTGGNGGATDAGGTGGFSFIAGIGTNSQFSVATSLGDGYITINSVSAVPLPAAAPLFGAGLIALGAAGYAAKRKKAAAA